MNRFYKILIFAAIVCFTTPSFALAEAIVSINPSELDSPMVGEQFTVDVGITGGESVVGYQFTVTFNPNMLSFIGIENANYLQQDKPKDVFVVPPIAKGDRVTLAAASLAGATDGDGTLARVTFEVIAVRDNPIGLMDVALVATVDGVGVPLDVTTISGTVKAPRLVITEHTPGREFLLLQGDILKANTPVQCFIPIWEGEMEIEASTFLEYQVAFPVESLYKSGGTFLHTADGNQIGKIDATVDTHWAHRKIALDQLAGQTIVAITLGTENRGNPRNPAGQFGMMVDNIQITDGTQILTAVWVGEDSINGVQRVNAHIGDAVGIENCEAFVVTEVAASVSPKARSLTTWGHLKTAK